MSIRDRIKKEAESGGWRPHPIGSFAGVIEKIDEKEHDGKVLWEISVRTEKGIAKATVWKTTSADIDGELMKFSKTRAEAEDKYVKAMGRLCRLFTDVGLEAPDGESEEELENNAYERMGELIDRPCKVVVQANPAKPDSPRVYINAPERGQKSVTSQRSTRNDWPGNGAAAEPDGGATDFGAAATLDDVPFMRRLDEA